jgi:hypothetical protein
MSTSFLTLEESESHGQEEGPGADMVLRQGSRGGGMEITVELITTT